jgi:hypothetical protein
MKLENAVPIIILVCGVVQIILGIGFFIDYATLIGIGWTGAITTALSFVVMGIFYTRSKNKGEVFDERFRIR